MTLIKNTILLLFLLHFVAIESCMVVKNQRNLVIINDPDFQELQTENMSIFKIFSQSFNSNSFAILAQTSAWQRYVADRNLEIYNIKVYAIGNSFVLIFPEYGFDYNNMRDGLNLEKVSYIDNPNNYKTPLNQLSKSDTTITQALDFIFPQDKRNDFTWNIMVHGHGIDAAMYGLCDKNIIAGLERNEFKSLLHFLNTRLKTNLLIYDTCFGGSKASLIETYTTNGVPNKYNYPIIVRALGDSLTYATGKYKPAQLMSFFDTLKYIPLCPSNLKDLAIAFYNFYDFSSSIQSNVQINSILQIRWPYTTEFKPIPLTEFIAVATELPERKSIFGTRLTELAIILDKPYISEPITLTEKQKLESSIPGQIWHYIKSIRSPQSSFESLMESFTSGLIELPPIAPEKRYLIDRYEFGENIPVSAITKIMIVRLPNQSAGSINREMYYIKDGIGYLIQWTSEKADKTRGFYSYRELDPKELERYIKLFEERKIELEKDCKQSTAMGLSELTRLFEQKPSIIQWYDVDQSTQYENV